MKTLSLFILVLLLASCAPAAPQPTVEKSLREPVIVYTTSGGIAGITTTWTFYSTGKITSGADKTYQAEPQKVAALRDSLLNAGFARLSGQQFGAGSCADCIQTSLTLWVDASQRTLTFTAASAETPADAIKMQNQVFNFLNALAQQN